ncbi:MAG: hypothetical protein ACKO0Z_05815 [Betaproteobacteria bacterium]
MDKLTVTIDEADAALVLGRQADSIVSVTTSRNAALTDANALLRCENAVSIAVLDDTATGWSGNRLLTIYQAGTGSATFAAGSGVVFRGTAPTPAQYKSIMLMRVGANEWAYV